MLGLGRVHAAAHLVVVGLAEAVCKALPSLQPVQAQRRLHTQAWRALTGRMPGLQAGSHSRARSAAWLPRSAAACAASPAGALGRHCTQQRAVNPLLLLVLMQRRTRAGAACLTSYAPLRSNDCSAGSCALSGSVPSIRGLLPSRQSCTRHCMSAGHPAQAIKPRQDLGVHGSLPCTTDCPERRLSRRCRCLWPPGAARSAGWAAGMCRC